MLGTYLKDLDGASLLALGMLGLFFILFMLILWYAFTMQKSDVESISQLPLEPEQGS